MQIFLDRTVSIHRLSQVNANSTSYTTYTTTMQCTIQHLGDEKTAMAGGSYGKMFKIFMDVDRNVQQDDKLKDKDGNWYKVVSGGVENRNDGFMADYLGVVCQKLNK